MKRETLDRFVHKSVTITFIDGEIAKGTLEYDKYHSNKYILLRPTEDSDICFPLSLVKSIGSFGLYDKLKEQKNDGLRKLYIENAREPNLRCNVSCLDLEDALRERDKQIRAGTIAEFKDLGKLYSEIRAYAIDECIKVIDEVNWIESEHYIELLKQLKEQKHDSRRIE